MSKSVVECKDWSAKNHRNYCLFDKLETRCRFGSIQAKQVNTGRQVIPLFRAYLKLMLISITLYHILQYNTETSICSSEFIQYK